MKTVRDTGLLFQRYTLQLLRNPVWLFVGFSTPVLYLLLFTPLLKNLPGAKGFPTGSVLELFLPGILALLAFTSGSRGRVQYDLRATIWADRAAPGHPGQPARHFDRAHPFRPVDDDGFRHGGRSSGRRVRVYAPLGGPFRAHGTAVGPGHVDGRFSTATALVTKDISSFAAIINGMNLPLLLLSGVLLPIALGPLWLRVLAHFNPLYYLVVASRALAVGHLADSAVWQAFAVLIPLCVLVLIWATRVFRRAVS